jgi:hypothetical protein
MTPPLKTEVPWAWSRPGAVQIAAQARRATSQGFVMVMLR